MSNYVTIYEEYKHKFFQLPKVFFTSDKYKNMSNNAKVAWALLRDRSSLSKKNKWYDKDTGRIYFIFKNKELMKLLSINSEATLVKVKKELIDLNLIEQKRIGFNQPNKLYLLYPEVELADIEKIDEFENYEYQEENKPESLGAQGTLKNEAPKNEAPELQNVKPNDTESSNTEFKEIDTIDTVDTKKASSKNDIFQNHMTEEERKQQKELYMSQAFYENNELVPERIAHLLKVFSSSPEEAKKYYDIILLAKKNAEKETGEVIWLEHEPKLEHEIVNTFSRSIRKIEKERNVKNRNGYIYKAIYDLLVKEITHRQRQAKQEQAGEFPFFNWLEDAQEQ